jgi:hypothetical protein
MGLLPLGQIPFFQSDKTPEEILGSNKDLFETHYKTWVEHEEDPGQIKRKFNPAEKAIVAELNQELLDNGYRIKGISVTGHIEWYIITWQDLQCRHETLEDYKGKFHDKG